MACPDANPYRSPLRWKKAVFRGITLLCSRNYSQEKRLMKTECNSGQLEFHALERREYEDLNDHDVLRSDALLALLVGLCVTVGRIPGSRPGQRQYSPSPGRQANTVPGQGRYLFGGMWWQRLGNKGCSRKWIFPKNVSYASCLY